MPSSFKIDPPPFSPLGDTVPALTPHAVSVSLPTWQDVVDYEEGEQRIKDAMTSGYPRFFIHHQIQKVSHLVRLRAILFRLPLAARLTLSRAFASSPT